MSDDHVKRLRDARKWFNNNGQCCGQVDSVGTCAAPACIFGEALKEFYQAADRIEAQAARIAELEAALATTARVLHKAGEQFSEYAKQHAAKGTAVSDLKADFNKQWAERCFSAYWRAAEGGKDEG